MRLVFSDQAWDDYLYWQQVDKAILKRINELIKDIKRAPFAGIGKPEALKHHLSGFWSRRINSEHRIVYRVNDDDSFEMASCRYHY
ncbi:toxin YoeB [Betaproteobacteria bacterium]|nr:toxin YoeB [Betaproteobacteria bacterium]